MTADPHSEFATLSNYRHSPRTRTILTHLACVVCPPDAQRLGLVATIVDHVELSLRALPTPARLGIVVALRFYDWGAIVSPGSLGRRSCSLSESQAVAYFDKWWRHRLGPVRELTKGIKSIICMSYCEMPEIKALLGFHSGKWMEDVKHKRLTVHANVVARHQESLIAPDPLPNGWMFGGPMPVASEIARGAGEAPSSDPMRLDTETERSVQP